VHLHSACLQDSCARLQSAPSSAAFGCFRVDCHRWQCLGTHPLASRRPASCAYVCAVLLIAVAGPVQKEGVQRASQALLRETVDVCGRMHLLAYAENGVHRRVPSAGKSMRTTTMMTTTIMQVFILLSLLLGSLLYPFQLLSFCLSYFCRVLFILCLFQALI